MQSSYQYYLDTHIYSKLSWNNVTVIHFFSKFYNNFSKITAVHKYRTVTYGKYAVHFILLRYFWNMKTLN